MGAPLNNLPLFSCFHSKMSNTIGDEDVYEEVDLEEMEFDEDEGAYYYDCPCGDRFRISEEELLAGQDIAVCPSCSLRIKVRYAFEDEEVPSPPPPQKAVAA